MGRHFQKAISIVMFAAIFNSSFVVAADTGYEGGLAVKGLPLKDQEKIRDLPLQDLLDLREGRYRPLKEDGSLEWWCLDALKARMDITGKPNEMLLDNDDIYQTERTIFADPSTGVTIMKLGNIPYGEGADELNYFGKSCFNANGSLMHWSRSKKPNLWGPSHQQITEVYGPMQMTSDGTRPRIICRDREKMRIPVCDPNNPNKAYAMSGKDIVEIDLQKGLVSRIIKSDLTRWWWLKISPDSKYVMNAQYAKNGELWVIEISTGKVWAHKYTDGAIHDSYMFVPANTDWIMYWYEKDNFRKNGLRFRNFKTGEEKRHPRPVPGLNHSDVGRFIAIHTSGGVYNYDKEKNAWIFDSSIAWPTRKFKDWGPYYDIPAGTFGAYCAHWPDDQLWAFSTAILSRPHLSELKCFFAKPFKKDGRGNRFRVCLANGSKLDRKKNGPGHLERPNISPDGTKLLFNSNVFGVCDAYMVQLKKPLCPVKVRASWKNNKPNISWDHPRYHREIRAYHVYRSTQSGRDFEILTNSPVEGTDFIDNTAQKGRVYFYAIRSVEYSNFESELSEEVAVSSKPQLAANENRRLFFEAESAISADMNSDPPDALWVNIEGFASNLYYIWQRRTDIDGTANIEVNIPERGAYYVYARVKGVGGVKLNIAGKQITCNATKDWTWVRSEDRVTLEKGKQNIAILCSLYRTCLDCFYLAEDKNFKPAGRIKHKKPARLNLTVEEKGKYVLIAWNGLKDKRFSHYNLYAGAKKDFECNQRTLIASPDKEKYLDWQILKDSAYYRISQVTRDGIESEPSDAVKSPTAVTK